MGAVLAEVAPTLITVVIRDLNCTTSVTVVTKRDILGFYVFLLAKMGSFRAEEIVSDKGNHLVSLKTFLHQ